MKNINRYLKPLTLLALLAVMVISSCQKDNYYVDGGKSDPVFKGNILQYLESNPKFDTIAQIVKLAGMEDVFANEKVTFFAPTDEVIRRTIGQVDAVNIELRGGLNQALFNVGKDTIKTLSDVDPNIWKKFLSRYIFKGVYKLKDYPQLDFDLKPIYPGSFYKSYNGDLANIGVVYNGVNGVKYTGYRQLSFSYIPDSSNPSRYIPIAVATSDIQPSNGIVHVLAVFVGNNSSGVDKIGATEHSFGANFFGFDGEFVFDVILSK
ncbi:MAG: hypothetical protein ACOH2A_07005 [Sphingobacteriaceae bacterium]